MNVTEYMESEGHEQLCVLVDKGVGLRAFIAIHDTTLGPALGGVRIWPHKTEDEAILDVLRLSKGMTYKAAAAGLDFGGGKALIMASPQDKTEAMMRAFGRSVDSLGGRYVTTEDVGATDQDLEWIALETPHVSGLPVSQGGSGGPATATAYGIYKAMKACAARLWDNDSLQGRVVAVQGFGKVASIPGRIICARRERVWSSQRSTRLRWQWPASRVLIFWRTHPSSTKWSATSSPRVLWAAYSTTRPYPD